MRKYDSKEPEPVVPGAQEKRCSGPCGRLLPPEAFGKDRYRADGRKSWCKACSTARNRAYRAANPEHARERDRAQERRHPGDAVARQKRYRDKMRATDPTRFKAWKRKLYMRHRKAHIRDAARWAARYPERMRAAREAWRAQHPDAVLAIRHRRRARSLAAPGQWTATDIALIYEAQRGRCAYCVHPLGPRYHRDHLTPLRRGGTNYPCNLALACRACNQHKGTRTAGQFFAVLIRERRALGRRVEE